MRKKLKKISFVFLFLMLCLQLMFAITPVEGASITVWDGTAATAFAGGTGTSGDPYQIYTAKQLAYLAQQVKNGNKYSGTYFKLMDYIVLNDESFTFDSASGIVTVKDQTNTGYLGTGIMGTKYHTATASVAGTWYTSAALTSDTLTASSYGGTLHSWQPIGYDNTVNWFEGTFDGNNKTVNGLYINSTSSGQGLFGYTHGAVQKVGVDGSIIIGGTNTSGVAGFSSGSVTCCFNSGIVIGKGSNIGGVVGSNANGTVSYSYNVGAIMNNINGSIGGVVGNNTTGTVSYSYNMGNVSSLGNNVGGVVGSNSTTGTVNCTYNSGAVTNVNSNNNVGGIVGSNSSSTVSYSYNSGCVNSTGLRKGGVIGYNNAGTVTYCYYDKQMCPVGGIYQNDSTGQAEGRLTSVMTATDTVFTSWSTGTSGTSTWILESGLYPRLTGYVDATTDYNMETVPAAYVSATPIRLSYTNDSTYETVKAVQTSFTVNTANGVSWASSDTTVFGNDGTLNAGGSVTMEAKKQVFSQVFSKTVALTTAAPSVIPTGGSFTDGDGDKDQISGSIAWTAANPTANIDGYKIYWGSDATTKLAGNTGVVYTVSGASTTSQAVSVNTTLPSGAKYFLIYSYNSYGNSASCLAVSITDITPTDYIVTNNAGSTSDYRVNGGATAYATLTDALVFCAAGGDTNADSKILIQLGTNSASPLVIPQSVTSNLVTSPNKLVSATYMGNISIQKDNAITSDSYGLYVPVGNTAHLSDLTITKNSDIDITNCPLSVVHALGTLYVEAGTNIETTKTQNCVGVNGSSAKFYMTGGSLSHDATGSGNCVYMMNGSESTISGGSINVSATTGSAVTNNGTGTVNISGGNITSNSYAINNNFGGAVNISGGTVEATGTNTCINNSNGTVAISEANVGTPTKIISAGTTVTLVKGASNPSGTIFGKTFHASTTAGADITGAINAAKNEINKDNYSSATALATGINSPTVFTAWTSDVGLTNEIGTTNNVTILSLTTGANSLVTDIYIKGTVFIPTKIPTNGSFTDTDSDKNQISGSIAWTVANPTTNIEGYKIYWGSDATTKLAGNTGVVYTVSGASTASQAVSVNTARPAGANYFLIYSYNSGGDSATCLAVHIIDLPYEGLTNILSQNITTGSEAGSTGDPKKASISVANSVSSIAATDIIGATNSTVVFYGTDSTFTTVAAGSVALTAGSSTTVYAKVTAQDGVTVQYYAVGITRAAAISNSSSSSSSSSRKPTTTETVKVVVNGKTENAGTETNSSENGKSIVSVVVSNKIIESKIEEAVKNNSTGQQNVIQVPVTDTKSDIVKVELTGDIVKQLETNTFDVSVKRDTIEYIIPAKELTISNVAKELGVAETSLKDIKVNVQITKLEDLVVAKYNEVAKANGATIVFPPTAFEVVANTTSTTGKTKDVNISKFSNYVERIVEIPTGVDSSKITTGIVFNDDGTYSHVPTEIYQQDSKTYAKLSSLTNSNYSVVWNPVTVESVENHWSKDAVNDMASRLIVFNAEAFEPNKEITRADFAEYIVRALGVYREGTHENKFEDVSATGDRTLAILIASEYGIVTGYSDGTFKGDNQITREEAMTMYQRAMKVTELTGSDTNRITTYTDSAQVSNWAVPYVTDVLSAHVFNGTTATTISPKANLTYAEAAQAIKNLLVESKLINE